MNQITGQKMKQVLFEVIEEFSKKGPGFFQSGSILHESANRLGILRNQSQEQALLTLWNDLFRQGLLSWGYDLSNADPPFCHITDHGRESLATISRDPANPDGYFAYLRANTSLNSIAASYVEEALKSYNTNCHRACAVMIGCAAESLSLELRDELVAKLQSLSRTVPRNLNDWRIRTVMQAIQRELDLQKANLPQNLREDYESYWPAFTQQIRSVRNDAGHPSSIVSVTSDSVHASLLIFPQLAILSLQLKEWISNNFV